MICLFRIQIPIAVCIIYYNLYNIIAIMHKFCCMDASTKNSEGNSFNLNICQEEHKEKALLL